jgi:hypothetical protein
VQNSGLQVIISMRHEMATQKLLFIIIIAIGSEETNGQGSLVLICDATRQENRPEVTDSLRASLSSCETGRTSSRGLAALRIEAIVGFIAPTDAGEDPRRPGIMRGAA